MSEVNKAVETLKTLRKNAIEKAERLMGEIVELEQYAEKLGPIIEMAENLPELGAALLSTVQPAERRRRPETVAACASKEKMYVALRERHLTVKEIAMEIGLSENYVSTLVKECVDDKVLDRHPRFDGRLAIRIIDEDVRIGKVSH